MLRTLFKKFGLHREEIFVNSKQGFVGNNAYEQAGGELIYQELLQNTNLKEEDFCVLDNSRTFYSMHPTFLNYSLNYTRKKLNLHTIDAVLLSQPFETTYWEGLEHSSTEKRKRRYFDALAKAFEFYESAVAEGRIRSYGMTGTDSLLQDPVKYIKALRKGVVAYDVFKKKEILRADENFKYEI